MKRVLGLFNKLNVRRLLKYLKVFFIWQFFALLFFFVKGSFALGNIDCQTHIALCQEKALGEFKFLPVILAIALLLTLALQKYILKKHKITNIVFSSIVIALTIGFTTLILFLSTTLALMYRANIKSQQPNQSAAVPDGFSRYTHDDLFAFTYPIHWQKIPSVGEFQNSYIAFSDKNVYLQVAWGPADSSYDHMFAQATGSVVKSETLVSTTLQKQQIAGFPALLQLEQPTATGSSFTIAAYVKGPLNTKISITPLSEKEDQNHFIETYMPIFGRILSSFTFIGYQ